MNKELNGFTFLDYVVMFMLMLSSALLKGQGLVLKYQIIENEKTVLTSDDLEKILNKEK